MPREQTSVVYHKDHLHEIRARSDLPHQGFRTNRSKTGTAETTPFRPSLTVVDSKLHTRCFLLPTAGIDAHGVSSPLLRLICRCCRRCPYYIAVGVGDLRISGALAGSLWTGALRSSFLLDRGVPLQVPEENVGGLGCGHGEVDVLRLQHRGVRRPPPGVANVCEGDLDRVSR